MLLIIIFLLLIVKLKTIMNHGLVYITNEIIDLEKHVKILNNRLKFISILQ